MKTIAQQLNITEFPFIIKDKNGNQIYFEHSNGYWYKKEFDSNGNRICFEDSEGYWYKKEFDSNGNRIFYEDSEGYCSKREFDSNGDETYFQDSNGVIRDNRLKPTCEGKVVEIDGKKYKLTEV
jgi:hypothetical protein